MHPIIYLVLEFIITVLVIGFTAFDSKFRLGGLFFSIICVVQCIPNCMLHMKRTPWAALVGGYSVTYLYHYLDVAILSRWTFEHASPATGLVKPITHAPPRLHGSDTIPKRLSFGLKVASSFRFVGTPYEVQNVPQISTTNRKTYLLRTYLVIVISYAVLDFINSSNDLEIAAKYLTLEKIRILNRLSEVTAEEVVIRLCTTLAAAIGLNCVQGGIYYIISVLAVSSRVSSPAEWPPFYGSPREAYTLRRFWKYATYLVLDPPCVYILTVSSVFWHQTNARKFSSISHSLVHEVLGLSRGTLIGRHLRILVAFVSSGVMHLLIDLSSGISFRNSGAMKAFLAQALGLIIEDSVMSIYQRLPRRAHLAVNCEKALGFIWVVSFLTWSIPAYIYPMMWRSNQGLMDSTIPFSLFGENAERGKAIGCLLTLGLGSIISMAITLD
jgi:hypothetical protein